MPNAVVHVLFTIILIDLFRDYIIKNKKLIPLHYIFIGGVAGLLPDIDYPIFWFFNFIGLHVSAIHRTFTHSLLFPLMFLIITVLMIKVNKKRAVLYGIITFGVFFHIFLDFLLVGKLMPFYPFSFASYGLELISRWRIGGLIEGLDAVILLVWLYHEEKKHRISDFI